MVRRVPRGEVRHRCAKTPPQRALPHEALRPPTTQRRSYMRIRAHGQTDLAVAEYLHHDPRREALRVHQRGEGMSEVTESLVA